MGCGEFLSSKATNEWILSERKREEWEMDNYPDGEIKEMIDIFKSKGMSTEDSTIVIVTMAKYKDFFVDLMMEQELELQVSRPAQPVEVKTLFSIFENLTPYPCSSGTR
jgi:DNA damage-binding protein 1